MLKKVLIIDDDQHFAEALCEEINSSPKYSCEFITDHKIDHLDKDFDYLFIDLRLKNFSGLNLISIAKDYFDDCEVFLMTGFGTISTAVEAMKQGAADYITKPITLEKIQNLIENEVIVDESEDNLSLDRVEREYIEYILLQENGNITRAAKRLGLHRQSLQRKLRKWVPRN